jgi:nucleoid-associated protein YgaU
VSLFSTVAGTALSAGTMAAGNAKAMLVPETIGMPVIFDVNPKTIKVKRRAGTQGNPGTINNPLARAAKYTGPIQFSLGEARLVGALSTRASVEALTEWAQPVPKLTLFEMPPVAEEIVGTALTGAQALAGSAPSAVLTRRPGIGGFGMVRQYELPVLLFMWGLGGPAGTGAKVQLTELSATYNRFDWTGMPVMATVTMTLEMYETERPFTNPSSGGVPGRSRHVLADGENVIGVATEKYGAPSAWRAVAQANGIDDPLRVRPGQVLHLPGPSELTEGDRP